MKKRGLAEQLHFLEATLASMADGVIVVDAEGRQIFMNEAGRLLAQREPSQDRPVEKKTAEFRLRFLNNKPILPEESPLGRALRGESVIDFQLIFGRPDGTDAYFSNTASPVRDDQGNIIGAVSIFRAITENKQTEERIRFQASLLDAVDQAIIATDLTGNIIFWNRYAEDLYGWQKEEMIGRRLRNYIVPEEFEEKAKEIMVQLRAGGRWSGEFLVTRRDGTTIPVLVTDSPIFDDKGQMIGIIGVSIDISERKRIEEAVRESEERLRLIISHSPDIIFSQDCDLRYTWIANPASSVTHEQVLGKTDFDLLPREEAQKLTKTKRAVLETGISTRLETALSPGGIARFYDTIYEPLRDSEGNIVGVAGYSRDITERKSAEDERERLLAAESKAREKAEHNRERITSLMTITARLAGAVTIDDIADVIIDQGIFTLRASAGSIELLTDDGEYLEVVRAIGYPREVLEQYSRFSLSASIPIADSVRSGEYLFIESRDELLARYPNLAAPTSITKNQSYAALPLAVKGKVIGALGLSFDKAREFNGEDRSFLISLAWQCAQALDRAHLYEKERKARTEAERTRGQLEAILQQMPSGVIIAEVPSGKLILGNEQVTRIWRHPFIPSVNIKQYFEYKGFHPDGRPYQAEEWPLARTILSGEIVTKEEIDILRGDGTHGTILVNSVPIRDQERNIVAGMAVFYDITEQKKAQKELRESEIKYRIIADNTYAWEFWLSTERQLLYISPSCEKVTGYTAHEFEEKPDLMLDILHSDDRGLFVTHRCEIGAENTAEELEFRIIRRDGEVRWIGHVCQPVFDSNGSFMGRRGSNRDITERKRAEENLRSERDFSESLINTAQAIVLLMDTEGRIIRFNPFMEELSGYLLEEVRGKDWFSNFLPERDRDWVREVFKRAVNNIQTRGNVNPIITKDGRELEIEWWDKTLKDTIGRTIGVLSIGLDVTERILAHKQIEEMNRMKDQFITVAAHELKTPVTIMKGYAQTLLRSGKEVPPQMRKVLEAIDRGANRIDGIVGDLLDITQLLAGRLDLIKESIDLPAFVEQVIDRVALTVSKHQIRLLKAEPVVIQGDRERLEQVLVNLCDNAVRYSPAGGNVDLEVTLQDHEVMVSVRDFGIGIPKENQSHIFERFYRAHTGTPYDYGGMGVGLFISGEIVSRHGGRMWFESEEGKGSTFYFSLPVGE